LLKPDVELWAVRFPSLQVCPVTKGDVVTTVELVSGYPLPSTELMYSALTLLKCPRGAKDGSMAGSTKKGFATEGATELDPTMSKGLGEV